MINIGDEVVLVIEGMMECEHGSRFKGKSVKPVKPGTTVIDIRMTGISSISGEEIECCCPTLVLSDGTQGHHARYRKVIRDTEPADEEFTALIKEGRYVDI